MTWLTEPACGAARCRGVLSRRWYPGSRCARGNPGPLQAAPLLSGGPRVRGARLASSSTGSCAGTRAAGAVARYRSRRPASASRAARCRCRTAVLVSDLCHAPAFLRPRCLVGAPSALPVADPVSAVRNASTIAAMRLGSETRSRCPPWYICSSLRGISRCIIRALAGGGEGGIVAGEYQGGLTHQRQQREACPAGGG